MKPTTSFDVHSTKLPAPPLDGSINTQKVKHFLSTVKCVTQNELVNAFFCWNKLNSDECIKSYWIFHVSLLLLWHQVRRSAARWRWRHHHKTKKRRGSLVSAAAKWEVRTCVSNRKRREDIIKHYSRRCSFPCGWLTSGRFTEPTDATRSTGPFTHGSRVPLANVKRWKSKGEKMKI